MPSKLKHCRIVTPVASQSSNRLLCSDDPNTLQLVTKSVNLQDRVYKYSHKRFGPRSARQACRAVETGEGISDRLVLLTLKATRDRNAVSGQSITLNRNAVVLL